MTKRWEKFRINLAYYVVDSIHWSLIVWYHMITDISAQLSD